MKSKKISIIMPVYNVEDYIKQTLDSILNQTLQELEVIIIDDKSSDSTVDIINSFNDNRIKQFKNKKNIGYGLSANNGIEHAVGDYLFFLGGDDLFADTKALEVLYNNAINKNVLISGGNIKVFDERGTCNAHYWEGAPKFLENKMMSFANSHDYCAGYTRFIYKREFVIKNKIYFPNYPRRQDPVFFIKAMGKADGKFFASVQDIYLYRVAHKKIQWNHDNLKGSLLSFQDCFVMYKKFGFQSLYKKDIADLKYYLNIILLQPEPSRSELLALYKNIIGIIPIKYKGIDFVLSTWIINKPRWFVRLYKHLCKMKF